MHLSTRSAGAPQPSSAAERRTVEIEQRVLDNLELPRRIAAPFARRIGQPVEDVAQVATIGLILAAHRYDPSIGPFGPFAKRTIFGELRHFARDCGWSIRPPRRVQELALAVIASRDELAQTLGRYPTAQEVAEAVGADREGVLEATAAHGLWRAHALDMEDTNPRVAEELDVAAVEFSSTLAGLHLSVRERAVLTMKYEDNMTQSEVAQHLGVSEQQVSRDVAKVRRKLMSALGETRRGES